MEATTVLYSIIAAIVALTIAVLFYIKSLKQKEKLGYVLTSLRFISIFALFLLLINPKTKQQEITLQKPTLAVAIDASTSISTADQSRINDLYLQLQSDLDLNEKFDVFYYSFGKEFSILDSLEFKESQTNISLPIQQIEKLQQTKQTTVLLVTDGIQTIGVDYSYLNPTHTIYPIVVGDTTKYEDLAIAKVFVNKYSYLDNQFPVEVITTYDGSNTIKKRLDVSLDGERVYSEQLNFSTDNNTVRSSFFLPASKVGIHEYKLRISSLDIEKNTNNNSTNFVVEIIDEQAQILLLTSIYHPDISGFKKAINSSKQRNVTVATITETIDLTKYDAVILYQPTQAFKAILDEIELQKMPFLMVAGSQTDWDFLNAQQDEFRKAKVNQTELYTPIFNPTFGTFNFTDIGFKSYPPLKDRYGQITFNKDVDVLLYQQVGAFTTEQPLLVFYEVDTQRKAILFGENSWQWRMQDYLQNNSFNQYDAFIAKIFQYLTASQKAERLVINAETVYDVNSNLIVESTYLNKNFEPDANAIVWLELNNKQTNTNKRLPFRFTENHYEVDLSSLEEGTYTYKVDVENENISKTGTFKVLGFDIEKQKQRAEFKKLGSLAAKSRGEAALIDNYTNLINSLKTSDSYKPISTSQIIVKPLIEWQWLLALIVLSLTIEWLLRKYNGLI